VNKDLPFDPRWYLSETRGGYSGFLIRKPAIFRKVKEIKHLSGGVVLYVAQSNAQIDAEIAEKGGFRAETSEFRL